MRLTKAILIAWLTYWLAGCAVIDNTPAQDVSSAKQMEKELAGMVADAEKKVESAPSANINDALVPPLSVDAGLSGPAEARFDISVDELAARDFFISLVKGTHYNIVVHPQVTGNVSLEMTDVTVDEVMQVVRDVYGYDYVKSGRLYRVLPTGMRTQMFKINYLNVQRMGTSETRVSAGQVTDVDTANSSTADDLDNENLNDTPGASSVTGTRIRTSTSADFWASLAETLQVIVGPGEGRRVVVSPQSGIVVVHARPAELRSVQEFLDEAELSLRRQVVLEAKILEVQLNDGFQSGINWSAIASIGGDSYAFGQTNVSLSGADSVGGVFSAAFDLKNFSGVIELLGTQGTVQVLSSPRISTVNNQKAVIKVGTDEFFVTEVSSQTTVTTGVSSTTPTIDVELTPFFSGIALDVTPQISDEGEIILHVHPTVSEVEDQTRTVTTPQGDLALPLAVSTIRESDSVVRAKNGQVVVIGGLMQNSATDTNAESPGISKLPVLGHLFRQKRQSATKSELVILLKPILADDDTWKQLLDGSRSNISGLRKAITPGVFKK